MKKYLIIIVSLIFIVPSIALASWWNPLSWFNNWNFGKTREEVKETQIQEIKKPITEENTEIKKDDNSKEIEKSEKEIKEIKTQKTTVSNNAITPSNISISNTKDLCPNIDGIQAEIPSGRYLYRNTNECLTEKEIDSIGEIKKEDNDQEDEKVETTYHYELRYTLTLPVGSPIKEPKDKMTLDELRQFTANLFSVYDSPHSKLLVASEDELFSFLESNGYKILRERIKYADN